jgi:hypothetical protein
MNYQEIKVRLSELWQVDMDKYRKLQQEVADMEAEALEVATEAVMDVQPELDPHKVLGAWEWDSGQEVLAIAGSYAQEISEEAFQAGEAALRAALGLN